MKGKARTTTDELTLRFAGPLITPEEFRKAVQAFVELLLQVSEDIAQGGVKPLWNMSVRSGSNVLVARPVVDVRTQRVAREAIRRVKAGVTLLERGRIDIPHFNRRALLAARDLAGLRAKPNRKGIVILEIGTGKGRPSAITSKTAELLEKTIGVQRQSFGSVEGRLQTITERGSFQFVVFDALSDRGVNCFVPQEKFKEAIGAFGKRVNVSGIVQYDRDGHPVSIKVDSIRIFHELEELPPIEHFRGLLKGV